MQKPAGTKRRLRREKEMRIMMTRNPTTMPRAPGRSPGWTPRTCPRTRPPRT